MNKPRLKDMREDHDKEQKEIAKHLGISQQYYSRYELGQVELPIRHYITLAKYYNTSIDYLCGLSDTYRAYDESKKKTRELTQKEKKLLNAYKDNPQLQAAIDKLLDIKV